MRRRTPRPLPDYWRAAHQRLEAAEFLLQQQAFTVEAMYLAGYVVECALKALLLARMPRNRHVECEEMFRGTRAHSFEWLKSELMKHGCRPPIPVNEAIRKINTWSTDLRYAAGYRDHTSAQEFVDAARCVRDWVKRSR